MYTEAEAKTKLCPFIRRADSLSNAMCVATGCMAWRVAPSFGTDMADAKDYLESGRLIEAMRSWRAATGDGLHETRVALEQIRAGNREWPSTEGKGFCGAAGPAKAGAA